MENVRLKSFKTYEEEEMYFAHIVYRYEDNRGLWEMTVPKVCIPVEPYNFELELDPDGGTLNFGLGRCRMYPVDMDVYARKVLIEEKIHNMTVEEIEEKLGYRVRIVKGEDKND